MFKIPNYLLAISSALFLSAAWLTPFTCFIFFAFVPLFILEDAICKSPTIKRKKIKIIGLIYLAFFIWNTFVTWWISYASLGGAAMAIISNSAFMCIIFMHWHHLKLRINKAWVIWLFIPLWLGYEYGNTLWDLTWTWLTLGNVFAFSHKWIQWYEFTGTSGGSLWVLIVNISIYNLIQSKTISLKYLLKPLAFILLPILLSLLILNFKQTSLNDASANSLRYKTLIIQPNVDPYNEKFYFEPEVQLHNVFKQISEKLDSTIHFLVLPETFLTENIFEGREQDSYSVRFLKDSILKKNPKLIIITGANTLYTYKPNEALSATAQKFNDANEYYDSFNTAIQLSDSAISFYHKSKLVPGVERMPFPSLLKPLEGLAIDLGGTIGSLGSQDYRTVFYSQNKKIGIAPVICYESVYSDYVTQYVRNGANLIFIITNDGWWENTPGHRQHLAYARLRAIETRREIARCANTGISCFITPFGEIEQATNYWKKASIIKQMTPQHLQTWYVIYGDLISYSASLLAILLITWSQILRFKKS
jgi:apolipoprotein N-acyltransferase